eukprot:3733866-Prymnesium_polylepis.1
MPEVEWALPLGCGDSCDGVETRDLESCGGPLSAVGTTVRRAPGCRLARRPEHTGAGGTPHALVPRHGESSSTTHPDAPTAEPNQEHGAGRQNMLRSSIDSLSSAA